VKKLIVFFFVLTVFSGCKQNDPLVAEAFHHKLYLSDVKAQLPYFSSKEDSLLFMEQYVEMWILHQTLLAQALQNLSQNEQNLSPQIKQYKEQLLINAYLLKLTNHSSQITVSFAEINEFLNETKPEKAPEYRNMVKLNYIKLSENSKLYKQVKDLFFDEKDRASAVKQLEALCADTIEYYLDGDHWFYTDIIEKELPLTFSNENIKDKHDIVREGYRYLISILDKKQQLQPKNVHEDRKMAQTLLLQQKKVAFVNNYQDSIVQKAINEKKAVRYSIAY
jgi:hypothetical protein